MEKPSCCAVESKFSYQQKVMDTICRLAIGVFAALSDPVSFFISFGIGLSTGLIYSIIKLRNNEEIFPGGESKPVCAQGYMDFLSGMRFPAPAGTIAMATFIVAHTRCDPTFYIPFSGVFLGFWAGTQGALYARDLTSYAFRNFSNNLVANE